VAAHNETGRKGEALVAEHLQGQGWHILGRNVRDGPRELDVVARRGRTVLFVEVKTRRSAGRSGHPLETIGPRKRQELERAAYAWARTRGRPGDRYRFDAAVVWLLEGRAPSIELFPDAWRPGW